MKRDRDWQVEEPKPKRFYRENVDLSDREEYSRGRSSRESRSYQRQGRKDDRCDTFDDEAVLYNKLKLHLNQDGQLNLSSEDLQQIKGRYRRDCVVRVISDLIQRERMTFPYKRYFISDIETKFDNLCKYSCAILYDQTYTIPVLKTLTERMKPFTYLGRYTLLPSATTEYDDMNILSDYFQEQARIRSQAGYRNETTLDYWKDPTKHKRWISELIRRTDGPINSYVLREQLYQASKLCEPSTFKATVARTTLQLLGKKRVLDFCAGWGDRLLGALSYQDELEIYVGVDPNVDLFHGYEQMIQRFAPKNSHKFHMICKPFEASFELPVSSFDMIFTGPPYYDYEKYGTTGANQSIDSFPTLPEWTVHFLFFCIEKAWQLLEVGGVLALNLNDVKSLVNRNQFYTEAVHLMILVRFADAKYQGVFSFTGANCALPRPIWVYYKCEKPIPENREQITDSLKHLYPDYFELFSPNE